MAGFIFSNDPSSGVPTYEEMQRQQAIAQALAKSAAGNAPQNVGQGLTAIGRALAFGLINRRLRGQENAANGQYSAALNSILGGDTTPAPASAAPSVAPSAPQASPSIPTAALSGAPMSETAPPLSGGNIASQGGADYAKAISGIESGGNYGAVGPQTKTGDVALGKYQVMASNVPQWTKDALGTAMTPQQFLADPKAQDAVFQHQFGQYVQKYGPEGAAKAWFAGEGGMNNPNASDSLGTTVAGYAKKFVNALGPTQAQASETPALAFNGTPQAPSSPAQSAIAQALTAQPNSFAPVPAGAPAPNVTNLAVKPTTLPVGGGAPSAAPASAAAPAFDRRAREAAAIRSLSAIPTPQARTLAGALLQDYLKNDSTVTVPEGSTVIDKATGKVLFGGGGKPTFGVIGETPMGGKQYGFTNPGTKTVTPYSPPNANGAPQDNLSTLHGEDFLSALEKQNAPVASQVRAIVEGRAPYPTGMLLKTPYGQTLAQYVTQADPSFESGNPTARVKVQTDLATGKLGQNNNALNTAIGHLGELSDAAQKLGNGKYHAVNAVRNFFSAETGSPEVTNFNTIRDKVAEEFTRVYRGAGGSESDIAREISNLNAANSPQQLNEAIANMASLAESKIRANEAQYSGVMGPLAKKRPMVTDKTQQILELLHSRVGGGSAPQPSNTGLPPGWTVQVH